MLCNGERQVAPTLDGIRRDHTARYEWASARIGREPVIDVACGIGYGAWILACQGAAVQAIDREASAIDFAVNHYAHPRVQHRIADVADGLPPVAAAHYATCFETIEHIEDPRPLLKSLANAAQVLLCSVPNENEFPYGRGVEFHFRHYTAAQLEALLAECGWGVTEWYGQEGPESEVAPGAKGRTLIAVCERRTPAGRYEPDRETYAAMQDAFGVPAHVCILGLGPSLAEYLNIVKRLGGKHAYCDEVWGINAVGGVLMCDRVFHMDDVRIQEVRAQARPESNIARMLEWMRGHPGPILTSRAHPDYPGLVEYPLEAVINSAKQAYFNSTAAYAVALAVHMGVKKISVFGCDYTYPDAHDAEKGRACLEFWLGIASERGIKLAVPKASSLLDALHTQEERLYGYDTLAIDLVNDQGRARVEFRERPTLPTADEIEHRYDHSRHPSPLVSGK